MKAVCRSMTRVLVVLPLFAGMVNAAKGSERNHVNLFPKLHAGEMYTYQVRYQSQNRMKTESAVAAPMAPEVSDTDAQRLMRVEVLEVKNEGRSAELRLRLQLTQPETAAKERTAELTLHGDGRASDEKGIDILYVDDQLTIREWVAQFGMAGIFPAAGVQQGEKWKAEETVPNAALAGLVWEKEYTYVRDEVCPVDTQIDGPEKRAKSGKTREMCAVILTRETLKQKSSAKHATPEDFKTHELRTAGTARGTNEIVTYISLNNGLLVRGTEEAQQSMDAEVALADGGNRVHYNIAAHSHTEVLLVGNASNK